jgi:SsrA-binding protein
MKIGDTTDLVYNRVMKKKAKTHSSHKRPILNKRANFNYTATDSIEVGMVLTGEEIKSIRAGRMQLTGSYGRFLRGERDGKPELWLIGAQSAGTSDKQRSIKLLAHRHEIDRLYGLVGQKGMTLIPKRIFLKHNRAKLELNIARGTKEYEKREKLQKRDQNRDIARTLKSR